MIMLCEERSHVAQHKIFLLMHRQPILQATKPKCGPIGHTFVIHCAGHFLTTTCVGDMLATISCTRNKQRYVLGIRISILNSAVVQTAHVGLLKALHLKGVKLGRKIPRALARPIGATKTSEACHAATGMSSC